jgi:hypothetical protein
MADVSRIAVEYDSPSEKSPRTLIVKIKRANLAPEWAKFVYPMYWGILIVTNRGSSGGR